MTSRRKVLVGTAAGVATLAMPALTLPPLAKDSEPDPIFEIIEEHCKAWKEFSNAIHEFCGEA